MFIVKSKYHHLSDGKMRFDGRPTQFETEEAALVALANLDQNDPWSNGAQVVQIEIENKPLRRSPGAMDKLRG